MGGTAIIFNHTSEAPCVTPLPPGHWYPTSLSHNGAFQRTFDICYVREDPLERNCICESRSHSYCVEAITRKDAQNEIRYRGEPRSPIL